MWKIATFAAILILVAVALTFYKNSSEKGESYQQTVTQPSKAPSEKETIESPSIEVVAKNLEVPWALAFLPFDSAQGRPDKTILFTERAGKVKIIKQGQPPVILLTISVVKQQGESGLHGIAIHPQYPQKPYIYLYYTYSAGDENSLNRVSRFTFNGESLRDEEVIVDKIPGAIFHDGGRIKFGPDGYLYITTGDALNPSLSQDKNSLAGKILRVTDPSTSSGQVEIYSYGHRNPQGIAWDDQGRLWETEHGSSATDEVNLIQPGKNYGWPVIRGDQKQQGMESPILHSGSDTWAPAGMAYFNGSLYLGGLRGQALFEYNIETKTLKEHFKNQFGRIRDVVLGPDNKLYITTSNRDGRGSPSPDDDKIIRINPEKL